MRPPQKFTPDQRHEIWEAHCGRRVSGVSCPIAGPLPERSALAQSVNPPISSASSIAWRGWRTGVVQRSH